MHMKFMTRRETLKNIERIVISEELLCRKYLDNSILNSNERKVENCELIINKLGRKGDCAQYLYGIYFTPPFAPNTVPELKRLFMADACHVGFGEYTLFSCYRITMNGNMSPVGFVIVFGNENGTTWIKFWTFVKEIHQLINLLDVTIVTDQDKGQKSAITAIMDETRHFHCAHHRRGDIIKIFGLKSGNCVYSALRVYNRLMGCRRVKAIERKNKCTEMMHIKDAQYLNNLEDAEQYPAARSAQGPGIYMYHRNTSSAVESINAANHKMHAKTAVDPLNACILLMTLECKQFNKQCAKAWSSDSFLTPYGTVKYEEVFQDINALDFTITILFLDESYECKVCQNMMSSKYSLGKVVILKQPVNRLFFGTCTCGVNTRDSIPCKHMMAFLSRRPNVTSYS